MGGLSVPHEMQTRRFGDVNDESDRCWGRSLAKMARTLWRCSYGMVSSMATALAGSITNGMLATLVGKRMMNLPTERNGFPTIHHVGRRTAEAAGRRHMGCGRLVLGLLSAAC